MRVRENLLCGPLGFGAAPLGNMFRNIPDDEAAATVEAAWKQGTRHFDTAPFYGSGLSEIRLGKELSNIAATSISSAVKSDVSSSMKLRKSRGLSARRVISSSTGAPTRSCMTTPKKVPSSRSRANRLAGFAFAE
jgi:aryl-alcohol dehydrogenase-like predicted oxidoreductase